MMQLLNAVQQQKLFSKIGGFDSALDLINKDSSCSVDFVVKDDTVSFSLPVLRVNGVDWVEHFENEKIFLHPTIKRFLTSGRLEALNRKGDLVYLVILKNLAGESFQEIKKRAEGLGLVRPLLDVACFVRERFQDEDFKRIGFSKGIVVPHRDSPVLEKLDFEAFSTIRVEAVMPNLVVRFSETTSRDDLSAGWGFVFEIPTRQPLTLFHSLE